MLTIQPSPNQSAYTGINFTPQLSPQIMQTGCFPPSTTQPLPSCQPQVRNDWIFQEKITQLIAVVQNLVVLLGQLFGGGKQGTALSTPPIVPHTNGSAVPPAAPVGAEPPLLQPAAVNKESAGFSGLTGKLIGKAGSWLLDNVTRWFGSPSNSNTAGTASSPASSSAGTGLLGSLWSAGSSMLGKAASWIGGLFG